MQPSRTRFFAGAVAALALCVSPTAATAATYSAPVLNPLVAVSAFGTQASAQTVCAEGASAATAAGAAAAQGAAGCVLPATDVPPPPPAAEVPPPAGLGFGIAPVLLGLLGIAVLAALIASGDDHDNNPPVSPG